VSNSVYQTVILGGGFTGLFTALHLAHSHYPRSVILIDQNDRFCFKPLLYEYFSGQMEAPQVIPRFSELLCDSGIIFVQDTVEAVDLQNQKVNLVSGNSYQYSNLVLALGSVTGYFGTEGAQVHALPFRTQQDAIAIDRHLRDCLQRALQIADPQQRLQLLTVAVVGGGPSGVEMAATLADFLPGMGPWEEIPKKSAWYCSITVRKFSRVISTIPCALSPRHSCKNAPYQ
jgi:NADH dehydrogenase